MKFDMGQAWTDAVALLSKNRDLVVILAAVFLFLPSLALGVLAPTTELEAIMEANPDGFQDAAAAYAAESWPYMLAYLFSASSELWRYSPCWDAHSAPLLVKQLLSVSRPWSPIFWRRLSQG